MTMDGGGRLFVLMIAGRPLVGRGSEREKNERESEREVLIEPQRIVEWITRSGNPSITHQRNALYIYFQPEETVAHSR